MGAPLSLLQGARAFARDFPRDQMPKGYLWDVVDYVPWIIDASLTGRGGWKWGSTVLDGDPETGILAPFVGGEKLLVQTTAGTVYEVGQSPPYTGTVFPAGSGVPRSKQNPVMLAETVISPTGTTPPSLWRAGGVTTAHALHKNAPFACVYKAMMVTGGAPGEEDVLRFSVPGKDLTVASEPANPSTDLPDLTSSWDHNSFYHTSQRITGLAALRSAVLIFHPGSIERMRGSTPAHGPTNQGDMFIEPLSDRLGCQDARSIAYWNDNCIFADEHGVHMTDGAVFRNLISQGQLLYFWRSAYNTKVSLAGCVFMDYYMITLRSSVAPPLTLICDLNKRQWIRFSNIDALTYIASGGSVGMERIWAGMSTTSRLARIGPCWFPLLEQETMQDDDGTPVLPSFETPWYRLAQEGRKRIRFGYLSYDVRSGASVRSDLPATWRAEYGFQDSDDFVSLPPGRATRAAVDMFSVGYILSPQDDTYTPAGNLPSTSEYTRYRLPVGKFPYGIGFKVTQIAAGTATRVFDLQVEAGVAERSRV